MNDYKAFTNDCCFLTLVHKIVCWHRIIVELSLFYIFQSDFIPLNVTFRTIQAYADRFSKLPKVLWILENLQIKIRRGTFANVNFR